MIGCQSHISGRKRIFMKKKIFETINKVDAKLAKVNKKAVAIVTTATALTTVAFCINSIESTVNKVGSLVFSVIMLAGIFMTITGVIALVSAMRSDDHDQAAISKAVGKLIPGIVMLAAPQLLFGLTGVSYDTLGTLLFAGF